MQSSTAASQLSRSTPKRNLRWRVVDIVVASVIGVAASVVFFFWNIAYEPLKVPLEFTPGLNGLLGGVWLFAGVLGGLVIRKPGAAIYTELVAATVSALIGNQWGGFPTILWGLAQGFGAELVFAIFLYANWRLGVAMLAGAGAGLAMGLMDTLVYYVANDGTFKTIYIVSAVISGTLLAGLLSWFAVKGLAATGALSRFAAGRESRKIAAPAA